MAVVLKRNWFYNKYVTTKKKERKWNEKNAEFKSSMQM